jgi:hypothetical protein
MADYKEKLDEWQQAVRKKARDLDEKFAISDLVGESARAAGDAARRGAETMASGAERLRAEAERIADDDDMNETARRAASGVKKAGKVARDVASDAGKKAGEVFGEAKTYYDRASQVYDTGARLTRASTAATAGVLKARDWIKENPGKAAVVCVWRVFGIRAGVAFTRLDPVLLGAHPQWLTHTALPVYRFRKASEKFDGYLKKREDLISRGELDEAERDRVEFERKIAKYVGAPLLGAFSCAAGAAMWAQIFQPGPIVGAPISWLLGGNPFLDGIWLFANGVICFHMGYKFFMIALANQDEVARVVREIKGLLPAAAEA